MIDTTVEHRRRHTAEPGDVRVDDDEGDFFRIRMPLASSDEARDGRALERSIIEGWRDQIAAEPLPLFLDHGHSGVAEHRYGALGKVGYWEEPELVERDGALDLEADAVIADPDAIGEDAGTIREALTWLRTQAELGMPISSSAGWNEDTGDRDVPGGADLMEGSIVGIPSDPRTTTAGADAATVARAAEAASDGFDAATFLRELKGRDDSDPVYDVDDAVRWPVDGADGGFRHGRVTGVHEQYTPPRADEPITTPTDDEFVYEVAPYDRDEKRFEKTPIGRRGSDLLPSEMVMPDVDRDVDDPEFDEGNAVQWSWQGTPVHGRVAGIHEQYTPPEGDEPITGDDGEAVYSIHEWDADAEQFEHVEGQPNIGRTESSLSRSQMDMPPVNEDTLRMTDTDDTTDTNSDEENREDKDKYDRLEERVGEIHEMCREELDMMREMYESEYGDEDDHDDEGTDEEDESSADDPDETDSADSDTEETEEVEERSVTIEGEDVSPDEALERLRDAADADSEADDPTTKARGEDSGADDADDADPEDTRDADSTDNNTPTFSFE